jgi:type II secretory pathway component PulJ
MTTQNGSHPLHRFTRPNGFILLEVLVAMSLIMGAWMVSANAYQRLALNLNQQETKRAEIRRQIDAHELEIYSRAVALHEAGDVNNEFARVPGRYHTLRASSKSPIKGKR